MTTKPLRSTQSRTPFLGREVELAVLRSLVESAVDGRGAFVTVRGEPGIGKSRLVEEAAAIAREMGFAVLSGSCYEGTAGAPYLPLIEAIELGGASLDAQELRAAVSAPLSSHGPEAEAGPEQLRYTVFNAFREFLFGLETERPVLLSVEDVHWSGAPLILLLRHLAPFLESRRVVVLVTSRDVEGALVARLFEETGRLRHGRVIAVPPLDEGTVAAMVTALTGSQAPMGLARALHEQTEGNPFYIEEAVKHLLETGRLAEDWRWTGYVTSDDLQVPPSVRGTIEERLTNLASDVRRALTAAAVLGRVFDFSLLAAVCEMDAESLLDCLDEAVRMRLLSSEETSDGRLSFAHELIRQTLLGQVSAPRRQRLHLRVMQILQASGDAGGRISELAYHAMRAGDAADPAATYECVTQAAERAFAMTEYAEAARLYRFALRLAPAADSVLRCEALLRLGAAEKQLSDSDEAREIFLQAAEIARNLGDAERLARAALGVARSWPVIGQVDHVAIDLLRQAEAALGNSPTALRALVLSRLAVQLLYADRPDEVKSLSARAVETARQSGDRFALARVLQSHHVTIWWPGRLPERLAVADEMLSISREIGIAEIALWSYRPRIADLTAMGRTEEAEAELQVYSELADAYRQPIYIWQAAVRKAMLAALRGRLQEGERLASEAYSAGQRAGGQNLTAAFGEQMLVIRYLQGRLEELEPLAAASRRSQPALGLWRAVLAFIYAETGREAEARAELEYLAADNFARLAKDDTRLIAIVLLAVVASRVNDSAAADDLYEELKPYEGHMMILSEGVTCVGAADHYLGLLAATRRRWEMAERHFAAAEQMNDDAGAHPWLALSRFEHGSMLISRRAPGDRRRAGELLQEALSSARSLGMGALRERAERVLASHKGLTSRLPDGLTPREVEVLKLLASGQSNKQISEELVLSLRTTARHVTNIYGKIGAHNRADATLYAIRHSLIPG